MNFHETVMGKRFFEGTLPSLVKAVQGTNERLDKLIQKVDAMSSAKADAAPASGNGFDRFSFMGSDVDDSILDKAEEMALEDRSALLSMIATEIMEDTDPKAVSLIMDYRSASPEQRRVIDGVFISLCGWSLGTLLKKYVEKENNDDEFNSYVSI